MISVRVFQSFLILVVFLFTYNLRAAEKEIRFEKKKLKLNLQIITVEIADSNEKAERGLMYRRQLNENDGMLFVFDDERLRSFWMKNTFIDLDIGFFSGEKVLLEVHQMKASKSEINLHPDSCETKKPSQFVLEMSRGWYTKHNIKVGTKFSFLSKK
jgi:uncharacterized membrane protein (UPF0127 family)